MDAIVAIIDPQRVRTTIHEVAPLAASALSPEAMGLWSSAVVHRTVASWTRAKPAPMTPCARPRPGSLVWSGVQSHPIRPRPPDGAGAPTTSLAGSPVPGQRVAGPLDHWGSTLSARHLPLQRPSVLVQGGRWTRSPPELVRARGAGDLQRLRRAYNEIGVRRWFDRKRTPLGGKSPGQLPNWAPEDDGRRRCANWRGLSFLSSDVIAFRHADPRFPFLRETASPVPGRWNRSGDLALCLSDTPDGAWAEFLRRRSDPEDIEHFGARFGRFPICPGPPLLVRGPDRWTPAGGLSAGGHSSSGCRALLAAPTARVRGWFDRRRTALEGRTSRDLLTGASMPDERGPELVRKLAAALGFSGDVIAFGSAISPAPALNLPLRRASLRDRHGTARSCSGGTVDRVRRKPLRGTICDCRPLLFGHPGRGLGQFLRHEEIRPVRRNCPTSGGRLGAGRGRPAGRPSRAFPTRSRSGTARAGQPVSGRRSFRLAGKPLTASSAALVPGARVECEGANGPALRATASRSWLFGPGSVGWQAAASGPGPAGTRSAAKGGNSNRTEFLFLLDLPGQTRIGPPPKERGRSRSISTTRGLSNIAAAAPIAAAPGSPAARSAPPRPRPCRRPR